VGYSRTLKRGLIKRERAGISPHQIDLFKELRFSHIQHTLSIRTELAIFRDLQFHLELPLILSDTRSLEFAQNKGDSCGQPPETHCVTKANSTLIQDGFFPEGMVKTMAKDQVSVAGTSGGEGTSLYLLPERSGLDQLYLGLSWAAMNQARDYTKPTWILGFEARIAVGPPMAFNPYHKDNVAEGPTNIEGNTSIGQGLHHLHWFTTVAKRFKYLDPWMTLFYLFPIATNDSLIRQTDFPLSGQERAGPQQQGGVEAGLEIIPWERPEKHYKASIELRAKLAGIFEGRSYSELWEIFANNPLLQGPCRPSPNLSTQKRWANGVYCDKPEQLIPYPGITTIENYATVQGLLAFNLDFTQYVRARLGVSLGQEQEHYITFDDAGKDIDGNGIINYNEKGEAHPEQEINPMYRPIINQIGHRFRVAETTVFDFFVAIEGRY
jgi:hypothetical protein